MEILENLNRYNEQYQRVPATHQPLIQFINEQYGRQDRTLNATRLFLNRTGLYDLPNTAEAIRVIGMEKAQFENDQARRLRETVAEQRELRNQATQQRRQARMVRRANRNVRRAVRQARRATQELSRSVQTGEGAYTYKGDIGTNTQMGDARYIGDLDLPFIPENMPILTNIIEALVGQIPNGYYFSVRLRGNIFRGQIVENPNTTIAITRVSNEIPDHLQELRNHKRIALPSDRYAVINEVAVFFERLQGGSFTTKGYEALREQLIDYKILCPKSKKNCGKIVLNLYNVDAEDGHLSIDYMRSKSPVPVVSDIEEITDECILLYEGHYFVVKSLRFLKEQRTELSKKRQATPEYKAQVKARQAIKQSKEVLVYDIESENRAYDERKTQQIPVMLSHTTDGKTATTYYGEECADSLIKYLLSAEGKGIKYVYAFNGGNYDHILIRNAIINNGLGIQECRRSANSIIRLSALVSGKEKKDGSFTESREIIFCDLLSFTRGTLRQNFKNYGIAEKGSFDFTKITATMEGEDLEKLQEYCEWDTMGSFKLYEKIRDIFTGLGLDLNKLYTLSQGAFKLLKNTWKDGAMGKFRQPKFIDEIGRKASIGGRTEVFKHSFTSCDYDFILSRPVEERRECYTKITDYLVILDVVSQYPAAMCNNVYPVGDFTQTRSFQEDYLGIYDCSVSKPKNLKYPVCYDKTRSSYNLLTHRGHHTSVDINQMRKYGYTVKIHSGVYWEDSETIFSEYITKMFALKQNATKGTPQYEMYKTFINAVFGKCLQNDDSVEIFVIKKREDLVKMYSGRELKRFTMEWEIVGDVETGYYTYTTEGKEKTITDKLGHIGAFILSYSKVRIYDELCKIDPYYMDTDSLFLHKTDADGIKLGGDLGDFSDDLDGGRIIKAIFICKKMYYLEYLMPNGEIKVKRTGKGVSRGSISAKEYEAMLNNEVVSIKKDAHFIRDIKNGVVLVSSPSKNIKMNSGGRVFISANNSVPLGHEDLD